MRNTTDTVVLGIGKVYKSTVVDIRTILTSSVHARSSGGRRGGSFRFLDSDDYWYTSEQYGVVHIC